MTRKLIAAAAILAVMLACTKNEQPESNGTNEGFRKGQQVTLTFSASYNNQDNAPQTKVTSEWNSTTSAVDFKWEEGDQVKVTVVGSSEDPAVFTLSSGAGSSIATFTGKMPDDGTQYTVQYPVDDPDITTQVYSSEEAIPHDMMKFAAECEYYSYKGPQYDVVLKAQNAVLRLNLYSADQTIGKIVITNTTSSADPQPAYTLTCGDGVALGKTAESATPFYIVVPAGETGWIFSAEVFDNAAAPASICTFTPSAAQEFEANKVLNMPAKEVAVPAPSPALTGDFTISAGTDRTQGTSDDVVVKFSKGNLQATCTSAGSETEATYSWGFAANQWDCIGDAAGNTTIDSQTVGAVVDLFGWVGTSGMLSDDFTKYGISTSTNIFDYGTSTSEDLKADWADIATLPQISGRKWHTLSKAEWTYLLSTRKVTVGGESKTSYGEGSVNGVKGLIILPDNWDGSLCSGFTYGDKSWSNEFTESTTPKWSEMESAGCVFLPAAGYRSGSSLYYVDSYGRYRSSTSTSSYSRAYYLEFRSDYVASANADSRTRGYSVRLVCAAQ